jgi:hypothetical protein
MGTSKDNREAENGQAGQARDHNRELERAIRHALVLAAGKRVADQAHRRAVSKAHGRRPGRLIHLTTHLASYGVLLAYIWHRHRTPKDATA